MDFTNCTVVVTGAAGNLGRAVGEAFGARGARLVLVDLSAEGLERGWGDRARGAEDRHMLAAADLLNRAQADRVAREAMDRFGRIDVLCNIAGGFRMGEPVHTLSDATWNAMMDLNVRTLLNMSGAVVPHMLRAGRGRVVNVGAASALKGVAQMGAYVAAKSTVIRLTETMAAELREQGIGVNCVLPSIIDTPENRAAMPDADPARWVPPADLAEVVLFLASDAARAVHGAAVPVTGLS